MMLVTGCVNILDYVSGILKLMVAYENVGKATKYFRSDKDGNALVVNNNQIVDNHLI